jgi:hypothetical protein
LHVSVLWFLYPCREVAGVAFLSGNTSRISNSSFITVLRSRLISYAINLASLNKINKLKWLEIVSSDGLYKDVNSFTNCALELWISSLVSFPLWRNLLVFKSIYRIDETKMTCTYNRHIPQSLIFLGSLIDYSVQKKLFTGVLNSFLRQVIQEKPNATTLVTFCLYESDFL